MPYIIGYGGEPATGKSALMKMAMAKFASDWKQDEYLGFGMGIKIMMSLSKQIIVLGHYSASVTFGGTDAMNMAIQPSVQHWLYDCAEISHFGIWFEGDRLFNAKFLHWIKDTEKFPNYFFALTANDDLKTKRHEGRDHQPESWLKGRKTKVANMIREFNLPTFNNNTVHDLIRCACFITDLEGSMRTLLTRKY